MGLASALHAPPTMGLQWAPLSGGETFLLGRRPARLALPSRRTPPPFASTLVFSRRRNRNSAITSSPKKNNKLKKLGRNGAIEVEVEDEDDEEIDDDAFEALFRQLEEDLKKDDPSLFDGDEEDEEISEEELAKLDEQIAEVFDMTGYDFAEEEDEVEDVEIVEEDEDEDQDEEEEDQPVTLKNWQLRRLASALKIGRRKTNIKSLAAELCLNRPVVLELLRNPPQNLLMMSAALPDHEPPPTITVTEAKTVETVVETTTTPKPKTVEKVPVHVMQQRFSNQKRLKKAHLQTLEAVYRRTKRPTNAMISSIVHVTNLPRKRIVKWFEDKRSEEGVPDRRLPYQRSVYDAVE